VRKNTKSFVINVLIGGFSFKKWVGVGGWDYFLGTYSPEVLEQQADQEKY